MRSATFTDEKPSPIGVVHGPFSATRWRRIAVARGGRQHLGLAGLDRGHAGELAIPVDPRARRVEHAHDRVAYLGADAVAGDQDARARHR